LLRRADTQPDRWQEGAQQMRVKVDFNNLARGGQVRASLRHLEGEVHLGDVIEAYDPADDLVVEATVMDIDLERKRMYLQPHWEPAAKSSEGVGRFRVRETGFCLAGGSSTNYTGPRLLKTTPKGVTRVYEGPLVTH
jgi:hypothetical protein